MTKVSFELVESFCERSDCVLYEQYSGRSMYGEKCFGIVGSTKNICKVFGLMGKECYELSLSLMEIMKTDNMGLDMIFYFPGFQLEY